MKQLERQLARYFGLPHAIQAQSNVPWTPEPQGFELSAAPVGLTLAQDAIEVPFAMRPSLYWATNGLFLGVLGGGCLSGFALSQQIGPRAWLGFGPLCAWALLAFCRVHLNNSRRCRLHVNPGGVGVELIGAWATVSAEIDWQALRQVDIVTDKRGRSVLRLLGAQRTLYFGGAACHRKELVWVQQWLSTRRTEHNSAQE